MAKVVRIIGKVLLYLGIGVILLGLCSVLYFQGFWKLIEIMNPYNIINFIAMIATILPGILMLWWADKLDAAKK